MLLSNRLLFALLLSVVAIPLPAMTPALLSGKLGVMLSVAQPEPMTMPMWHRGLYHRVAMNKPAAGPIFADDDALLGAPAPDEILPADPLAQSEAFVARPPITLVDEPVFFPAFPDYRTLTPGAGRTFTSPPTSAVPEPAVWLTMIVGFMLVGSGLRRSSAARRPMGGVLA